MKIYEKAQKLQIKMKCNKGNFNKFGGYNFRSAENITEAIKPLLEENGLLLNLSDEVVMVGDRIYFKATATLIDIESGEKISSTAYAREEETKKGCDAAQISGGASSYSRKTALNGLLCLDDSSNDPDATNTHGKGGESQSNQTRPQQRPNNNQTPIGNKPPNNISITLDEAANTIMPAGKFANRTLGEILAENKGYITFVANTSKDAKLKAAAIKLLEG